MQTLERGAFRLTKDVAAVEDVVAAAEEDVVVVEEGVETTKLRKTMIRNSYSLRLVVNSAKITSLVFLGWRGAKAR
jgi:hypothetical protein